MHVLNDKIKVRVSMWKKENTTSQLKWSYTTALWRTTTLDFFFQCHTDYVGLAQTFINDQTLAAQH